MNINLLTIDSNLPGKPGTSPFPSKPDSKTEGTQFALTLEDTKLHANTLNKSTADNIPDSKTKDVQLDPALDNKKSQANTFQRLMSNNIKEEIQNHKKPVNISRQELLQSIDKRTKSENSYKADNKTKSKEQNTINDSVKQQNRQPNIIQIWLSENSIGLEKSKEGIPRKIEEKSGRQLNQIITNPHNGKSPSVTGHAVKSDQIKLLHTTEKGQLGLKTILPIKSMGQNGLKTITPDTPKSTPANKIQIETENNKKVPVSTKTIAETKSATGKGNIREFVPGVSDNTGENISKTRIKPPAGNINPTTVQDKTSEKQPQHNRIDPGKHILTAETDAKANKSQNIRNLSNPNNRETIPAGNNFSENQNSQKLNLANVQVTTGQTKDQSNLTSNKSHSQGFEQMLSQNNSQILIAEPTVSAKNATTANPTGRSSSSNVSADIGKQILESIQKSISQQDTDRQITVRLNPPELGKVLIRFQQQEAEITGHMEVNKAQTRFEIEQALPQIIRNLADCGIQIKRLEVTLSNEQHSGQGALGNQSLQSGGAQQQYSGNPSTPGNDTDVHDSNEWLTGNNGYENLSELQGTLITNGSINLLI
jgi:flagellar hook-length control protein FliK